MREAELFLWDGKQSRSLATVVPNGDGFKYRVFKDGAQAYETGSVRDRHLFMAWTSDNRFVYTESIALPGLQILDPGRTPSPTMRLNLVDGAESLTLAEGHFMSLSAEPKQPIVRWTELSGFPALTGAFGWQNWATKTISYDLRNGTPISESVLSRDRAPFRTKFSRLTCSPIQSARDYMRTQCDSQWLELNLVRELCLKRYFLLIRSRRLGMSQGYALFCQMERLELEYFESSERAQWLDLNRRYQELESQFTAPSNPQISSTTLTRELFSQLYAKILDGAIESVHLQRAIPLLHFPEVRRQNVESHSTYHWIWCSPNKKAEDLAGLRVEGHKLNGVTPYSSRSVPLR